MTTLPGPGNDADLPRVPLPDLRGSAAQFLEWCAPLLDEADLATTRADIEDLLAPDSPAWALQDGLEAYDARPDVDSWLDDFWRRRYLGRRDRIALNANFFFLFPAGAPMQAARAAELTLSAVDYRIAIDTGALEVPTQRGAALSTEQDKYLFSATRIPGVPIDTSRSPYTAEWPGPTHVRHVLVMRGGRAYRLDVLDADGRPYSETALTDAFADVLADPTPPEAYPVGALTTLARAEWASTRERLRADPRNVDSLDVLETALFCVCLDDLDPADRHDASDQLLHGAPGNRWFDKSLSFIVLADGTAGLNGEHCNLDGTTMATMVESLLDPDARQRTRMRPTSGARPAPAAPLTFTLDDELRAETDRALASFRAFTGDTESRIVSSDIGAGAAKSRHASPDGVVQMAIQLAQVRARGGVGSTYESIAMRRYRLGRTEAMRVVTPQSVRFVEVMSDDAATPDERSTALREAVEAHAARARGCQDGHAPEQHLWALQMLAQERGEEPPHLYAGPGWRVMRADHLSTSSVPSRYIDTFGFGSTSPTCIGVGYVLLEDGIRCYLSAPRTLTAELDRFARALDVALRDVVATLGDLAG